MKTKRPLHLVIAALSFFPALATASELDRVLAIYSRFIQVNADTNLGRIYSPLDIAAFPGQYYRAYGKNIHEKFDANLERACTVTWKSSDGELKQEYRVTPRCIAHAIR